MASTYLDNIVEFHRQRVSKDARNWKERAESLRYSGPSFRDALGDNPNVAVIAEVKRRSPSKGWINEDLDPASLAKNYVAGGASAISVLTDEKHFSGSVADLSDVRGAVGVPILRKDFTLGANDVLDCIEIGASAVLLIVAALTQIELKTYFDLASKVGLDALVEVHDEIEAQRAIEVGATIIGINQRDLHSFAVDTERAARVAGSLPSGVISICESGLKDLNDVENASSAGFDAVLIGETFASSLDPEGAVRALSSVAKSFNG
ncbi:MAG: indole-3-glycerol phosphate synthase TrpC [Acidimicrobiaceae bacterium]